MKSMNALAVSARLLAALPLAAAGAAAAQEGASGRSSTADSRVIEEIQVTATKILRSARELPVTINVFSGDDLDQRGFRGIEDFLKYTPGVTVLSGDTPDANQVNIRGTGSERNEFNRPFGLFYDDVPLVNPNFVGAQPDIDLYDMETIEVLKGPQGTLFGGSALVGAIRYVPNRPTFDRWAGNVSYGLGSTSKSDDMNRYYSAMLNMPLGEHFAARFAGSIRDQAGFVDDTYSGKKDVNAYETTNWRAMLSWRPSEDWQVELLHQFRNLEADTVFGTQIDNVQGRQQNGWLRDDSRDGLTSDMDLTTARITWEINDGLSLSLNGSYLGKDGLRENAQLQRVAPAGFEIWGLYYMDMESDQSTYELRLVQDKPLESSLWLLDDWTYVAGLYYLKADQRFEVETFNPQQRPNAPLPVLLAIKATADTTEKAFFFDASRFFTPAWEFGFGLRLFRQNTPLFEEFRANFAGVTDFQPYDSLTSVAISDDSLEEEGFNPRVSLTWHAHDNVLAFVSATRGFRFGGINLDVFNTGEPEKFFKSDSLWNYELGIRTTWQNGSLLADLTYFHMDWKDKQEGLVTTQASAYIANTGGREIDGLELGLRKVFGNGLDVFLSAAFVDSITTKSYLVPGVGTVPEGTREPETPRWTGSAGLSYGFELGSWELDSNLSYAYQGATSELSAVPLDEYGRVDFSLSLAKTGGLFSPRFDVSVINVLNDDSLIWGGIEGPRAAPIRFRARTLMPRTVMLTTRLSF